MKNSGGNIAILFFAMTVVMLGFGIIIPIMPFYVQSLGAGGQQLGMLMAVFSIAQFIFAPLWGGLSDRIGRKPILLMGLLGNAISQALFGFATTFEMMLFSRLAAGVLSAATLPTTMAYIGDSTDERNRSQGMGIIGAAMGIGMVLGPGIGGWLGGYSLSAPFFGSAALALIAMILAWVLLPESLALEKRAAGKRLRGPQLGGMWKALFGPLGFLFFLAFLVNFALASFEGIFGMYAADRHSFGPQQVGTIMTLLGLISALMQGLLTGPVTRRWGEAKVIKASLLASAVAFGLMLLARNFIGVAVTVGFFVLSNNMLRPTISSLLSKGYPEGQGVAMGLNNSFMSLGRAAGPLWAGFLYDINLSYPYISGAFIMLGSFVASLWQMQEKVLDERLATNVEGGKPVLVTPESK